MQHGKENSFRTLVRKEKRRQKKKWGDQDHNDFIWLAILMEEVGELSEAILENRLLRQCDEMVQVAAVIESWYEKLTTEI